MPLHAGLTEIQTPGMHEPWSIKSQPQIPLYDGPAVQAGWAAEFSNTQENYSFGPTAQQGTIPALSSRNSGAALLLNVYLYLYLSKCNSDTILHKCMAIQCQWEWECLIFNIPTTLSFLLQRAPLILKLPLPNSLNP